MLKLLAAFPGTPSTRIHHIFHNDKLLAVRALFRDCEPYTNGAQVYGSGTTVVLLDANTLALHKVLAFEDVFPQDAASDITCISVDATRKIVAAGCGSRIALWTPSDIDPQAWRVHSTLGVVDTVTALHCCNGSLAVGTTQGLAYYAVADTDFPTWTKQWAKAIPTPTHVSISPNTLCVASSSNREAFVRVHSAPHARQTQVIRHPLPINSMSWRNSSSSHVLYTTTTDDTLRIFMPVLDSPYHLQLHEALDSDSFGTAGEILVLDPVQLRNLLPPVAEADAAIAKIHGALESKQDLFVRVSGDGIASVRAISNIDHKPPTLLQQYPLITKTSIPALLPLNPQIPPGDARKIVRFIRTPAGHGVAVVREGGGDVWQRTPSSLVRSRRWDGAEVVAVMDAGRQLARFLPSPPRIVLETGASVDLPADIQLTQLFALLSAPGYTSLVGVTSANEVLQIRITPSLAQAPSGPHALSLYSGPARLAMGEREKELKVQLVLPVDPMVAEAPRDVLLSISEEGELAFWTWSDKEGRWIASAGVSTGRKGVRVARCSSMRKTVLVVPSQDDGAGEELTIWDSKVSEFSYGLEYRHVLEPGETVKDLDWTSNASSSILAVGFAHRVLLLCPQRMTYFEQESAWHVVSSIDISSITPYPIADSIWLAGRAFLVGSGAQMLLYGQSESSEEKETLFDLVARQNGPLEDYHPQMLLQCLLWGKVEVVKTIITRLALALEKGEEYQRLPMEEFLKTEHDQAPPQTATSPKQYSFLFNRNDISDDEDDQGFSRALVNRLISRLNTTTLPYLSANEQKHLAVSVQTTLEIEEQRRALDECGLRFLISMRSFYILNAREDSGSESRERLRYRDMVWAFHSESQDLLLAAATQACGGKMLWTDAKAVGLFLWLAPGRLKDQMEVIARNQYMAGDARDPTACCLFYFALGKARLVHGLWKQAAWHKEQSVMLKFLSNDFTNDRWRTAAMKNAYALLGKQRFEYAAAFFLLAGSLKDAVNVLVNQVGDVQLAVAIARVYEGYDEGPVLNWLLSDIVVPLAFREGNRWLGSWAFWMLRRRDLAVRILVNPLDAFARSANLSNVKEIGDPHYDDPSLALMFLQLKSKSLQTAKGSSEISGQTEFNFVLHTASVFKRMGCHVLALDLVQKWHFDRPSVRTPALRTTVSPSDINGTSTATSPATVTPARGSVFAIHPRRMASLSIDMDIPTLPPTRAATPIPEAQESGRSTPAPAEPPPPPQAPENAARQAGLGNLMKTAKQDVAVPEFNMDAFF
ncbi:hypothetical protein EXIGLDRAFT_780266 [Exidia glandulosa HHB12029]|uniref:RAVE complex protein Rav1 C-terminal domain-containing protein n=1 Tax=Exidia glandulosa HHB12029 TaxID=1314781 RepID=A0A165BP75_EXIGL|nr:hypothetical protein EXIGLDRAFT_780266 [Exidia glandulosa HHB12029]